MSAAQNVSGFANMTINFQQFGTIITSQPLAALVTQALQYVNATGQVLGVDQLYAATVSLASTTKTIHFQTSTAVDPFGNTLAMLRIRELLVQNLNTTFAQDLEVYASASNGITWLPLLATPLVVRSGNAAGNGGILRISDPGSFGGGVGNVVGSTSDGLVLNSLSATVVFNIVVLGCSVA